MLANQAARHSRNANHAQANRNRIILKAILTFETNAHLAYYSLATWLFKWKWKWSGWSVLVARSSNWIL